MRKTIITSCLIGSGTIILITSGFFNSLLLFLLVGKLPGLTTTLTADTMQIVTALGVATVLFIVLKRYQRAVPMQLEKLLRSFGDFFIKRQDRLRP